MFIMWMQTLDIEYIVWWLFGQRNWDRPWAMSHETSFWKWKLEWKWIIKKYFHVSSNHWKMRWKLLLEGYVNVVNIFFFVLFFFLFHFMCLIQITNDEWQCCEYVIRTERSFHFSTNDFLFLMKHKTPYFISFTLQFPNK